MKEYIIRGIKLFFEILLSFIVVPLFIIAIGGHPFLVIPLCICCGIGTAVEGIRCFIGDIEYDMKHKNDKDE